MDYLNLNWPIDLIVNEAKTVLQLPLYPDDWYDDHCVRQNCPFVVAKIWSPKFVKTRMPQLSEVLNKSGILEDLNHIQLFICRPHHMGAWHLDGDIRKSCINIPIYNTNEGNVEWTNDAMQATRVTNAYTTHWLPVENRLTEVCTKTKLLSAQLLRTDKWHRLDNTNNPNHRITISVRFHSNPTFEDLFQKVRP